MKRVAFIVLLSITAAMAVDKDKGRFVPGPASSYPEHQTQEGITIAAPIGSGSKPMIPSAVAHSVTTTLRMIPRRTAKIPQTWARFVTSANRTLKPNRETQELYPTMEAVSNPTSASELDHVVNFFQDAKGLKTLADVQAEYIKHLAEAKKKEVQA